MNDRGADRRGGARLQDDAAEAFIPSMPQQIDVADLYPRAFARMPDTIDNQAPLPVPPVCPVTLGDLLEEVMTDEKPTRRAAPETEVAQLRAELAELRSWRYKLGGEVRELLAKQR